MTKVSVRLKELRGMDSMDDLVKELSHAKEELFNLRFQLASNALTNNQRINELKKDIARVHTVIQEKMKQ